MPSRKHVEIFAGRLAITHRQLLDAADDITEDDLAWRPGPTAPSIAFHLWHCGRFADRWAEAVRAFSGSAAAQRWLRENLAERWHFPAQLGTGNTGMELGDEAAALLPFPGRSELATYLRGAFNDLEQALSGLDDESILVAADDLFGKPAPLADSLVRHLAHTNRHLGMIEALRGIRGGHGTATV
jgi:hypothetical protein